jgi:tetratricopeptide (TPR) repeat protein
MNELKQYQPDLFIVYSGQNEFLEQRSYSGLIDQPDWLINLNATLSGTRVYTALEELIKAVQPDSLQQAKARSQLSGEVDEILNHTIGPQSYQRDDTLKQHVLTHYRLNLLRMVKIARSVDAGILLVQPAVNLKDMSPFKSTHREGLDEHTLQAWQDLYDRAGELAAADDAAGALALYRQALALDDRYAELHYRMGQALFSLGRYTESEQAFQRAVEEDIAPLRMLGAMQRDVAEVAAEEDVPLVDFPEILRAAYRRDYPYTVFGKEYFVDHVHTNMEGYRLLGLALFDELVAEDIVHPDGTWNAASREAVEKAVIASLDPGETGQAMINLGKVLGWAGKFQEAYDSFRLALEALGPHPAVYYGLASALYSLNKPEEAAQYYQATLVLSPGRRGVHAELARIFGEQGKTDAAIEQCRAELELDPDNYHMHVALAELLEQQGDRAGAQQHLQTALQLNPQQHHAHTVLGLILRQQGDYRQAIRHFTEALRLEPGDSTAEENLRQLQAEHSETGVAAGNAS